MDSAIDRRTFLGGAMAFSCIGGCVSLEGVGERYAGWQPSEMDIHFIHTGTGEQTFFQFPDGTTMLLDCGHIAKRNPKYVAAVPAKPSGNLRGGEWVTRYLKRVTANRTLDYMLVSHWHDDHVLGLGDVAKEFTFARWLDHQYPQVAAFTGDSDPDSVRFALEYVPQAVARGMKAERIRVGTCDQIVLQHDAAQRYADFEVRNLASNGVIWDGAKGTRDYATEHLAFTRKNHIAENALSSAFRIRYGAFTYYTGGDMQPAFHTPDGVIDGEELVGRLCGPVDVCKTNHHAFWNAMQAGFVRAVQARVYLSSVWSPNQVNTRNLPIICSRDLYAGPRTLYHGAMPLGKREELAGKSYFADLAPAQGHVVVKVPEGGRTYEVFTLTAEDESMRVISHQKYISRGGVV